MKSMIFVILILFSTGALAQKKLFCTRADANPLIAMAQAHSDSDKNMHCAVSCMLTLKCRGVSVMAIGYLKEIKDSMGAGNAEAEDINADRMGIDFARRGRATTNSQCLRECDLYFKP